MKIIILILAIIFSSCIRLINAQCNLSNERKQEIIDSLNSPNYWHRSDALEIIWDCKIIEAKEIIENRFWEFGPTTWTIETLYELGSDLTYQYAMAYYDTLEDEIDQLDLVNDPDSVNWERKHVMLEHQVSAIEVLFKLNDYSKADKVIELLDSYPEEPKSSFALSALAYMIDGTPQYRERAVNEFENAVLSYAYSGWNRLNFLYILRKNLGQETFPIASTIFLQDTDQAVRRSVLGILPSYTNEDIVGFLKERLLVEPDQSILGSIVSSLLYHYGTPTTYNYVKGFAESNSDPEFTQDIFVDLSLFQPFRPDSTLGVDLNHMLDTLQSFGQQCLSYNWIDNILLGEINPKIINAKDLLSIGDSMNCKNEMNLYKQKVEFEYSDSLNSTPQFITKEGWQFLSNIAQYILDRLPEPPANPNLVVNLKSSLGTQIPANNVMYYEGSWKDAVSNGDGTFTVITTRPTVSIRVFYEYASKQADNVTAQNNTYTFTTVNTAVQLKNSLGSFIDVGTVQYYAGAWRSFGTTSNGVSYKELLPINYSFRMTYEYGSIDKQQNLSADPTVVFQTVNAAVQLKNSLGNLIDVGTVQYYAGAWRSFGTTSNRVAYKELLPVNYSFRMTYEFVSKDKQQNLSTNPVVDFSTVLCSVKVSKTSNNQPINNAVVKYYAGAWRNLGTTSIDGITTKELLSANISFRATYGNVSLDKQQDISVNSLVEILLNIP